MYLIHAAWFIHINSDVPAPDQSHVKVREGYHVPRDRARVR